MQEQGNDRSVSTPRVEEHPLFERNSLDDSETQRLATIQVELDQCRGLLRQRRALGETGHEASQAPVRPPEVVERSMGGSIVSG